MTRRKLHNQIQELRGNIRVFVRVRPQLPGDYEAAVDDEDAGDEAVPVEEVVKCSLDSTGVKVTNDSGSQGGGAVAW